MPLANAIVINQHAPLRGMQYPSSHANFLRAWGILNLLYDIIIVQRGSDVNTRIKHRKAVQINSTKNDQVCSYFPTVIKCLVRLLNFKPYNQMRFVIKILLSLDNTLANRSEVSKDTIFNVVLRRGEDFSSEGIKGTTKIQIHLISYMFPPWRWASRGRGLMCLVQVPREQLC